MKVRLGLQTVTVFDGPKRRTGKTQEIELLGGKMQCVKLADG